MDICAMQWHQAKIRILYNIRFFLTPKGRLLIHYVSAGVNILAKSNPPPGEQEKMKTSLFLYIVIYHAIFG